MPADLDPRDVEELRRRVIDPVVRSLVRPDELEEIQVTVDGRQYIVRVRACGEWILSSPAEWGYVDGSRLWDAEETATDLYIDLRDELVESRLSWGQWRDGEYEVPGPRRS
jgi:hypothetical protein